MNNDTAVAVELAALKEKVGSMLTTVEDIKTAVQQIVAIDRTVAQHSIHLDQTRKDIGTVFARIDEGKIADEQLGKTIAMVAEKGEEFKNQWSGATRAAGLILGFLQVVFVATCGWLFSLVIDADRANVRQQMLIDQLERKVYVLEQKETK